MQTNPSFPQVIRRDDPNDKSGKERVVSWNGTKIITAVEAACRDTGDHENQGVGQTVQTELEKRILLNPPHRIHIENLQDMVEDLLLELGFGRVALCYGKYRAARAAIRKQLQVLDTNTDDEPLYISEDTQADLKKRISFASIGLSLTLGPQALLRKLAHNLTDSLTERERRDTVELNARGLLDLDSASRFFAGRILLSYIYEETLPWQISDGVEKLQLAHQKALKPYLEEGVRLGRLSPDLLKFKLPKIAAALDPSADLQFDFLGLKTIYDRYLIKESAEQNSRRMEAPQIFWMRVAMGLAVKEKPSKKEMWATEFYSVYKSRNGCSSTPTLFNSGTVRPQLSSCYLLYCGDSMDEISETWKRFSSLSKWAGGLGCSWSAVRGAGSHIHGTNGESGGIVPFLKVSNDIAVAVNQGGKRPGALCSYLELWHCDIEDFLDLRKETGDDRRRTHNMNTAQWIPDLFMKRLHAISEKSLPMDATWTLFRSNDVPDLPELYGKAFETRYEEYEQQFREGKIWGRQVRVLALWKRMLETLFETGHPWLTFKDPCNVRSPQDHVGVIHNSNLCTEITLNTSTEEIAVCNLASINVANHLTDEGEIDYVKLQNTVWILMRMLDNVIDINFYPEEAARAANMRHRPVGLGMMGVQDALYLKRIPFDSPEAVKFHGDITEAISLSALQASVELASERKPYSTFKGSKWDRGLLPLDTLDMLEQERGRRIDVDRGSLYASKWNRLRYDIKTIGLRNSNCLAIAPTATISNIMGCTPCIEPTYKHIHAKSNLSGEFIRTNDFLLRDLQERGLWDSEMLKDLKYFDGSIQEIERVPEDLKLLYKTAWEIEPTWILQAAAARQKWLDQAQSVNLWLSDPDIKKASVVYKEAWNRGLKTTYYLRTLNKSTIDSEHRERKPTTIAEAAPSACSLEARRAGTVCESCQ